MQSLCKLQLYSGECTNGDVKLVHVDEKWEYEGRVEICYGGIWGTVCDDKINANMAIVVCRQLNLSLHGV